MTEERGVHGLVQLHQKLSEDTSNVAGSPWRELLRTWSKELVDTLEVDDDVNEAAVEIQNVAEAMLAIDISADTNEAHGRLAECHEQAADALSRISDELAEPFFSEFRHVATANNIDAVNVHRQMDAERRFQAACLELVVKTVRYACRDRTSENQYWTDWLLKNVRHFRRLKPPYQCLANLWLEERKWPEETVSSFVAGERGTRSVDRITRVGLESLTVDPAAPNAESEVIRGFQALTQILEHSCGNRVAEFFDHQGRPRTAAGPPWGKVEGGKNVGVGIAQALLTLTTICSWIERSVYIQHLIEPRARDTQFGASNLNIVSAKAKDSVDFPQAIHQLLREWSPEIEQSIRDHEAARQLYNGLEELLRASPDNREPTGNAVGQIGQDLIRLIRRTVGRDTQLARLIASERRIAAAEVSSGPDNLAAVKELSRRLLNLRELDNRGEFRHSGNVGAEVRQKIDKGSDRTADQVPLAAVFDRVTARDLIGLSQEQRDVLKRLLSEIDELDAHRPPPARSVKEMLNVFRRSTMKDRAEFVTGLSMSERNMMKKQFAEAERRQYCELIFGDQNPTLARLNTWLADHAGAEMNADRVRLVTQAVSYVRDVLKARLVYHADDGEVPCRLDAESGRGGKLRFRVRETGVSGSVLQSRYGFPKLVAKPRDPS